jgi:hypothetical protein
MPTPLPANPETDEAYCQNCNCFRRFFILDSDYVCKVCAWIMLTFRPRELPAEIP